MAFRWTALDDEDGTILAFPLNEARNWTDFTDALRDFVVPSQNFVYADVEGHIGYYAPGHIPIRANGDGSAPLTEDGWERRVDRVDSVRRAAAHLRSASTFHRDREQPAGARWIPASHRPEFRIPSGLGASPAFCRGQELTPDDFRAIQADTFPLHAQDTCCACSAHAHRPNGRP